MSTKFDWNNITHVKLFDDLCVMKEEYFNITNENIRITKLVNFYKYLSNIHKEFNEVHGIIYTFYTLYIKDCLDKFSIDIIEKANELEQQKSDKKYKKIVKNKK